MKVNGFEKLEVIECLAWEGVLNMDIGVG